VRRHQRRPRAAQSGVEGCRCRGAISEPPTAARFGAGVVADPAYGERSSRSSNVWVPRTLHLMRRAPTRVPGRRADLVAVAEPPIRRTGSSLCSRVAVDQVDQALPGRDQLGHVLAEHAPGRGKARADRVAFAEIPGPVARPGRVEKGVPPPARHRLIDPKRRSERLGPRRRGVATVSRNVEVASPSWTWSQTRRVATRSSLCRS
jgi:hypothetical protein